MNHQLTMIETGMEYQNLLVYRHLLPVSTSGKESLHQVITTRLTLVWIPGI